jgi:transposase InsO family protein
VTQGRALSPHSERSVCRALGISRSSLRYAAQPRSDEDALRSAIITLASQYGRYGYRLIAGLLRQAGREVRHGRAARIWQQEGLKLPLKPLTLIDLLADVMRTRSVPEHLRSDDGPEMVAKKLRR